MSTIYELLGIGNPYRHCTTIVEEPFMQVHHLEKGEMCIADLQEMRGAWDAVEKKNRREIIGGGYAIVAKMISYLGMKSALYGQIGNDEVGNWVKKKLSSEGIDFFPMGEKETTNWINSFITPDKIKTSQNYFSFHSDPSGVNLDHRRFENVRHVYLHGDLACHGEVLPKCLELAKAKGATVSLNLADHPVIDDVTKKAAQKADILFGNFKEMQALTGKKDPAEMIDTFALNQVVVITQEEEGCWVKGSGKKRVRHYDAVHVENVIDKEGARDFFIGGFLSGYLKGKSLKNCARLGATAESLVLQEFGSYLPKGKWQQLAASLNG